MIKTIKPNICPALYEELDLSTAKQTAGNKIANTQSTIEQIKEFIVTAFLL
jgi:hypothetical protein